MRSRNGIKKTNTRIGRNPINRRDNTVKQCTCPKCGYKTEYTRGIPCNTLKCPKCGTVLRGEFCL